MEWPPEAFPGARFVVCSAYGGSLGELLEAQLHGRKLGDRSIEVRRRFEASDVEGLEGCHLVYIGEAAGARTRDLLRGLTGAVLTAGEAPTFLRDGGMVRFLVEGGRVQFDVAQDTVESHGLKISSRLLQLARSVRRRAGEAP